MTPKSKEELRQAIARFIEGYYFQSKIGENPQISGYTDEIVRLTDSYHQQQLEQAEIRAEIRGKLLALEKMRMGAGEYHDDPCEYVVPLRHIKKYEAELSVFDLSDTNPIFRDKNQAELQSIKEDKS